jgi:Family of unknown function (DUF6459)
VPVGYQQIVAACFTTTRTSVTLMTEIIRGVLTMSIGAAGRSSLNYRPAIDSRPPAHSWQPQLAPLRAGLQPMLDFDDGCAAQSTSLGGAWMATPRPDLPDATAWSTSLARLLIETVQGLRPIGQLNRWVDERVLAAITSRCRHRLEQQPQSRPARPAVLRSLHVQFPTETAVEVAAHLAIDRRSIPLAFRLEEFYGRWLCTEVELGLVPVVRVRADQAERPANRGG